MRILSLTLRIAANLIAGHILVLIIISLLNLSFQISGAVPSNLLLLVSTIAFILMKITVSLIQVYVLTILIFYYIVEVE